MHNHVTTLLLFMAGAAAGSLANKLTDHLSRPSRHTIPSTRLLSRQYFPVRLISGSVFALLYLKFNSLTPLFIYAPFTIALLTVTLIDLEHMTIPDAITIPGILAGIACNTLFPLHTIQDSIAGMLLGGGLFLIMAMIWHGAIGGGDMTLAAMIGAFVGWRHLLLTVFLALISSSVVSLLLLATEKTTMKDMIPFGPFLAFGAIVSILWGDTIMTLIT